MAEPVWFAGYCGEGTTGVRTAAEVAKAVEKTAGKQRPGCPPMPTRRATAGQLDRF